MNTNEGLTRREALKKGARLGGALVWAVPVVQTIGMSPAMAQTVSEGLCCLRVEILSVTHTDSPFDNDALIDDIEIAFRARNCGSSPVYDVGMKLELSLDGGENWVTLVDEPALESRDLAVGGSTSTVKYYEDAVSGQTYDFRLSGTKKCDEEGENLPHDVPDGYSFASITIS